MPSDTSFDAPYPILDEALGERPFPDEASLTTQLADIVERGVRAQYRAGSARRDVHAKATGFLRAEFRVHDSIPADLAKGVFVPGKTYAAWIRLSNGAANPNQSDDSNDGRGLAIKLLDVPGEKVLETEPDATSQDFVMINHPVFFTNDPHTYLTLLQKAGSANLLTKLSIPIDLGLKGTLRFAELTLGKISNPLQISYFSASPYQFGTGPDRQVVKYSVRPASAAVDPMPEHPGADYLRDAMAATLAAGDLTLKFLLQPRTSDALSVEDCLTEWTADAAPFHEVATIFIPRQDFNTPERWELAENLSFNPWRALPDHRPLGSVNRMRKVVYERISRVRRAMNSVTNEQL